jgi:hypothetical protein
MVTQPTHLTGGYNTWSRLQEVLTRIAREELERQYYYWHNQKYYWSMRMHCARYGHKWKEMFYDGRDCSHKCRRCGDWED